MCLSSSTGEGEAVECVFLVLQGRGLRMCLSSSTGERLENVSF